MLTGPINHAYRAHKPCLQGPETMLTGPRITAWFICHLQLKKIYTVLYYVLLLLLGPQMQKLLLEMAAFSAWVRISLHSSPMLWFNCSILISGWPDTAPWSCPSTPHKYTCGGFTWHPLFNRSCMSQESFIGIVSWDWGQVHWILSYLKNQAAAVSH